MCDDDMGECRSAYHALLEALRDERIDLDRAAAVENLAVSLASLIHREVA